MNKKLSLLALLAAFLLCGSSAYAHSMDHPGGGHGHGYGKKTSFVLENQKTLGLTADQVRSIEDLKAQAEKDRSQYRESLKKILTPEQSAKLKELLENKKALWENKQR